MFCQDRAREVPGEPLAWSCLWGLFVMTSAGGRMFCHDWAKEVGGSSMTYPGPGNSAGG